ncbi:inositol monophosphatase family protein [Micromonospora chalcea]
MDVSGMFDELEESLAPLLLGFRSRLGTLSVVQKPDRTLLSEADVAVQDHIVSLIQAHDPDAGIIAEEGTRRPGGRSTSRRVWVVDPIDGTAEFIRPDRREYCSVLSLLDDRRPIAALMLAPEAGTDGVPLSVRVIGDGVPIVVNGRPGTRIAATPQRVSVTRSAATAERVWEQALAEAGFQLKTRTTSQTLDMTRTCVDLSAESGGLLSPFALFYREAQKVWDGAAGMCLARAAGLRVCDRDGRDRTTIDIDLAAAEPTFASTLVAPPAVVEQFLGWSSGQS